MDRHTVGTEVAKMAIAIITRDGWASAKTLSAAIPCDPRTAGRIIAFLKSERLVVKSGYGVEPIDSAAKIRPHSDTDEHSATGSSMTPEMSTTFGHNIRTSRDSATAFGHIRPSQLLNHSKKVQNEDGLGKEHEPLTEAVRAIAGSTRNQDPEEPVAIAALKAASATDDEEQQPWGPDENEHALLDYQEWLVRKHKTTEITDPGGAAKRSSCDGLIGTDRDMAAYHEDLDKLIAFLSEERDARKLRNRQLGKARGQGKITRSELHNGKMEADRASGELRYYNLQAAGETLDMCWSGWRQKMAMDPDLIKHYEDEYRQHKAKVRAGRREERRLTNLEKREQLQSMPPAPVAAIGMPEFKPTIDPGPAHEHADEENEDPEIAWRELAEDRDPTACGTYRYASISIQKTNKAPTPAPSAASSDPVQEPVEEAVSPVVIAPAAADPAYADAVEDGNIFTQTFEPPVDEDLATMKFRQEQEQQAERDEVHAAVVTRLDREMAQEAWEASVIIPQASVAPTEPTVVVIAKTQEPTAATTVGPFDEELGDEELEEARIASTRGAMPTDCVTVDEQVYWHVSKGLGRPWAIGQAIASTMAEVMWSLERLTHKGKTEEFTKYNATRWRVREART
jgi:hypothetical protein